MKIIQIVISTRSKQDNSDNCTRIPQKIEAHYYLKLMLKSICINSFIIFYIKMCTGNVERLQSMKNKKKLLVVVNTLASLECMTERVNK